MTSVWKIAAVAGLAVAVGAVVALRRDAGVERPAPAPVAAPAAPAAGAAARPAAVGRPRLLELGSTRCLACVEMAKVLDALRASQGARLQVDFIDLVERPEAAQAYKVSIIPTQILYDASGREIFRHMGFFSHDDILAKFRELGSVP